MKTNTLKAVAAVGLSALLMGSAAGQAVSQPVGFETLDYTPGFNYLGLRLVEAPVASGASVAVNGSSITVAAGVADSLVDGTSYLFEVVSGDAAGAVIPVTDFDAAADTVTLADDISGDFSLNDRFIIRPVNTLASVFGESNDVANSGAGLASAGAFASSDQVWIPDGAGDFDRYAYVSGNPFAGTVDSWQDSDGNLITDPSAIELVYTDGIIINGVSPGNLVVSGSVKLEPVQFALTTTFNYLSGVFPTGLTLAESELSDSLVSAGAFSSSDQIWFSDGAGGFSMYAFVAGNPFAGTSAGWQDSDGTVVDPATVSFDDNSGIIIVRAGTAVSMVTLDTPSFFDSL